MTMALENVLAKAGLKVDASAFLSLIEDAASKIAPLHPEPMLYFSHEQRIALADVGVNLSPLSAEEPDYRAPSVAAEAVFIESALTVSEAASRLGIDASRVRHRLAENQLTGWKNSTGWLLPAWQFTENDVLPGLVTVLTELPDDQPALVVAAFMNTPQADLVIEDQPVSPRQWLLSLGKPEVVAELLATVGEPA